MINKKIIAFGVVGSILLGGTAIGGYTSLAKDDTSSNALVNEVMLSDALSIKPDDILANELTVEPADELACGLTEEPTGELACGLTEEPIGELACELTAEPTGELACELTVEPTGELACELTAEPTDELACELTAEPTGELACELTAEPIGELACELTEEPTGELACELTAEPNMYNVVFDYFVGVDEALNIDMKYIAVNFATNIDDENKKNVLENLKKYNVDVIESNLEELIEKGLADEYGNLDGILLSISDSKVESENRVMISGSKYRSGLGSVSNQVILNNVSGTWEVEQVELGPVA